MLPMPFGVNTESKSHAIKKITNSLMADFRICNAVNGWLLTNHLRCKKYITGKSENANTAE